jgi:hypothetical protein
LTYSIINTLLHLIMFRCPWTILVDHTCLLTWEVNFHLPYWFRPRVRKIHQVFIRRLTHLALKIRQRVHCRTQYITNK